MPFSSGNFSVYTPGTPYVTGTIISSTVANNVNNDFATGLSTCILKDGSQVLTANIPFGGFKITGLVAGTSANDSAKLSQTQDGASTILAGVSGTNTITGTASPTPASYATGAVFRLVPANSNTGATTIDISSLGAKNIFWSGAACVGGEITQSVPISIIYDGTQFNIMGNGFNAPFIDTQPVVEGSSDATKKARFEVDGLTTATTRVYTLPDKNGTVAMLSDITAATNTRQVFTSGSGTYNTPAGCIRINIRMIGGGGGGGGNGTSGAESDGGTGGATTFSTVTASGGVGGGKGVAGSIGNGGGGGATSGSPNIGITGGHGGGGSAYAGVPVANAAGGDGGNGYFGGSGLGNSTGGGVAGATNSGGGGSGASGNATVFAGSGGGSGGYVEHGITSPSTTYSYGVGAAGTLGAAGTSGSAGGAGGSGIIIVDEFYT